MTIRTTRLDSGIRVVTERVPGALSVTTGFWVGVGARDEAPEMAGASHFLEHLLFKGTETRGAVEIAEAVDGVGGEMNAFTAHEYTAFHVRLPGGHLLLGLDILSDVVWSPALGEADVEAERHVILEELASAEDDHEDRVLALVTDALFPGHPLGREVLGSRESIAALAPGDIRAFHERWYRPADVVVAVAGAVDHDEVVEGVANRLAATGGGDGPARRAPEAAVRPASLLRRRSEQVHLAVGVRGLDRDDDDRFALDVANHVLGGGMSSRLFRTIREERGLAYAVYSYPTCFEGAGALVAYAGTSPGRASEVLDLLHTELDRLLAGGVTEQELAVATGYLEGSTLLGLEDPAGRMSRIGRALLVHGDVDPIEDVVARYRAVRADDVGRVVERVLGTGERAVAAVGPVPKGVLSRDAA